MLVGYVLCRALVPPVAPKLVLSPALNPKDHTSLCMLLQSLGAALQGCRAHVSTFRLSQDAKDKASTEMVLVTTGTPKGKFQLEVAFKLYLED